MANVLTQFSEALAGLTTEAEASVVRVEARRRLPATGIVWSADGLIMSANHVITRDDNIMVGLAGGEAVAAVLVGRDPATDTAVLRVDRSGLTPLPEADKTQLGVGSLALALGRPGQNIQATLGIISAMGGSWRTRLGGHVDRYLHTDVVMYPGFSGGPLVDSHGRLVGMNTSAVIGGVSLVIPVGTLARVADALVAHGRIRRGYLGVSTHRVKLPENLRQELGQKTGLLIVSAEADSPAAESGLTLGDTIVALDGQKVRHHDDLLALLSGDRVGKAVPVTIIRGGKEQIISVTIAERPE